PAEGRERPGGSNRMERLGFHRQAGGDIKGVKGRMYALDAKTGKIVWEFYLVPKAEGDPTRGPLGASPLNASPCGNAARCGDNRRCDLDFIQLGAGHRLTIRAGREPRT